MSIAEKMNEIAENVPLVYRAGQDKEWSDFWDIFQHDNVLGDNLKRNYSNTFRTRSWSKDNFKPKYDIIATSGEYMFEFFNQYGEIFDFAQHLEDLGVALDVSQCTSARSMFYFMYVGRLPEINLSGATTVANAFNYNRAATIDKLTLKSDGSQTMTNAFSNMPNLKNIVIEGAIGQNGVNLSASTQLSGASITSFVNALLESASGKSITFSLTAVNNAFETSAGAADGSTAEEWGTLIATKSNWTISLA